MKTQQSYTPPQCEVVKWTTQHRVLTTSDPNAQGENLTEWI